MESCCHGADGTGDKDTHGKEMEAGKAGAKPYAKNWMRQNLSLCWAREYDLQQLKRQRALLLKNVPPG